MCPSYMVTRDEQDSTRGRAHLLFEMLEGSPLQDGWKNESVKEALDLCLACKGCKKDCPVNVDMATYKAEFLSHYYEGRMRPRHAYAMGKIFKWAKMAAWMPRFANFMAQTPGLSAVTKFAAGISSHRQMPRFAPHTFRSWFKQHPAHGGKRVMLWADTFNNHFDPEIAVAAVNVLEHCGYEVVLPPQQICCGRPLYDFGFLDEAKSQLQKIVAMVAKEVESGTWIVGLEPSCVSVFRQELTELLPHDEDAKRLSQQTRLFSEFINDNVHIAWPQLGKKAIVQTHCHEHAVMGAEPDLKLLEERSVWNARKPEVGLLRDGGRLRIRPRALRRVDQSRRARAPATRARGSGGNAHRDQWLQLSDADRATDRAQGAARRTSPYWRSRLRERVRKSRQHQPSPNETEDTIPAAANCPPERVLALAQLS